MYIERIFYEGTKLTVTVAVTVTVLDLLLVVMPDFLSNSWLSCSYMLVRRNMVV